LEWLCQATNAFSCWQDICVIFHGLCKLQVVLFFVTFPSSLASGLWLDWLFLTCLACVGQPHPPTHSWCLLLACFYLHVVFQLWAGHLTQGLMFPPPNGSVLLLPAPPSRPWPDIAKKNAQGRAQESQPNLSVCHMEHSSITKTTYLFFYLMGGSVLLRHTYL
jgi:hypothetical protein